MLKKFLWDMRRSIRNDRDYDLLGGVLVIAVLIYLELTDES